MNFNNTNKSKEKLTKLSLMALVVFFIGFSTYNINLKIKMNSLLDTAEKTDYNEESISSFIHQCESNYISEEVNLLQSYQEKYDILKKAEALKKKIFSERYNFLNNKASNGYKVEVCIPYQEVYVYKNNKLLRSMVCSTGIDSKPTPIGYFSTEGKGKYFFSEKYAQGAFYWINFLNNNYLFHTLPVDYKKNIIQSEALKLGEKASHGCIRLSFDDAKWLYNTIPSYNTLIYIH